jgi:FkbM family methyltransferase
MVLRVDAGRAQVCGRGQLKSSFEIHLPVLASLIKKSESMKVTNLSRKVRSAQEIRGTYENWPHYFLSRLGMNLGGVSTEIKVRGSKLLAPNDFESWGIADQVWRMKVYTKHFPILDGYRVLDVGAHFGFFSVFAARQNRGVKVVSYEPSKTTFGFLRRNLDINLDPQNTFAFNFGLSDKSEESIFFKPKGHDASGTLFKKNIGETTTPLVEERVRIELATRIWDVFASYDFAKLDCEGAELPILRCLGDQIRRLGHVVLEYHEDPREIVQLLLANGFSIMEILPLENNSAWNAFTHLGMLYAKNNQFRVGLS